MTFDVIVIGTGPGGEGAAMKAAKSGKAVAVVERYSEVGGGCTHWGTIPSKALRHAVQLLNDVRMHPLFSRTAAVKELGYADLVRSAEAVVSRQVKMRLAFYQRNHVRVLSGHAAFTSPTEIEVTDPEGGRERHKASAFILATGSRPYRPPDVDFTSPRVLDSDKVLDLAEAPRSLAIYGAGVVGCEYASIFRSLGAKVTLIDVREKLLSFLDDEIIDALSYHLRDQGVLIRHGEQYEKVQAGPEEVAVALKSGKRIKADYLLWANGRTGNSDRMGLEAIGVKTDGRGYVVVNESYQSSLPHVYAVGDLVGFPSLASAAYDQGRFAATHLVEGAGEYKLVRSVPTGIYTSPEVSSVGPTERELTQKRVPYEVGHAFFRDLARAQIAGYPVGMLKILFHRETLEVLGVHCFGYQASEIIHIGQAVMSQAGPGNSLLFFINTTFNYPTMAEAYRVAALNGLNRVQGIFPARG